MIFGEQSVRKSVSCPGEAMQAKPVKAFYSPRVYPYAQNPSITVLNAYMTSVIKGLHLLGFLMPPVSVFDGRKNHFGNPIFYLSAACYFMCAQLFAKSLMS